MFLLSSVELPNFIFRHLIYCLRFCCWIKSDVSSGSGGSEVGKFVERNTPETKNPAVNKQPAERILHVI